VTTRTNSAAGRDGAHRRRTAHRRQPRRRTGAARCTRRGGAGVQALGHPGGPLLPPEHRPDLPVWVPRSAPAAGRDTPTVPPTNSRSGTSGLAVVAPAGHHPLPKGRGRRSLVHGDVDEAIPRRRLNRVAVQPIITVGDSTRSGRLRRRVGGLPRDPGDAPRPDPRQPAVRAGGAPRRGVHAVGSIARTADVRAGQSVCIWAVRGLGAHAVAMARLVGAVPVIAVDPLESARARTLALGADAALDPTRDDVTEALTAAGAGPAAGRRPLLRRGAGVPPRGIGPRGGGGPRTGCGHDQRARPPCG
jgi:hypothetical protein